MVSEEAFEVALNKEIPINCKSVLPLSGKHDSPSLVCGFIYIKTTQADLWETDMSGNLLASIFKHTSISLNRHFINSSCRYFINNTVVR